MASITVFEISADPFSNRSVDVQNGYSVEVTDNDALLQKSDNDGSQQIDLSGLPNAQGSTQSFSTFESYSGEVNGAPVTFILIQFSNPRYIIVTSGNVAPGDTISDTGFVASNAPDTGYNTLPSFVCFTAGSMILTPSGQRLIDTLRPGDPVIVADGTARALRWIGRRRLSAQELRRQPHLRPVQIRAGSLSANSPSHDLLVSPQHRIAVSCPQMELMYSEQAMLAPAKGLIDGQSVVQLTPDQGVEYIHILFDRHELVNVNGCWSESFYPGACSLCAMAPATQRELFTLFPELASGPIGYGATALPVLKTYETRLLRPHLIAGPGQTRLHPESACAA